MTHGGKRLLAAGAVVALLATGTACSTRPGPDELYLYYSAGSVDKKEFLSCVEPNTKGDWSANNDIFTLPTSLRTWNIRPQGGDTDQPIKSGTKPTPATTDQPSQPGPEVHLYANAEFYLNTDCSAGKDSPIVQFWERTGRRYHVSKPGDGFDEDAWRVMLLNTLVPAQEKVVREATRDWTADQLDANLDRSWSVMEKRMGPLFNSELRAKVGGDYFCGPEYKRGAEVEWEEPDPSPTAPVGSVVKKRGTCPPVRISITDVNFADPGIAAARANVFKALQDAKAAYIAAESQVAVANKLAQATKNPDYLRLKALETWLQGIQACAANPNCTTFVGDPPGLAVAK